MAYAKNGRYWDDTPYPDPHGPCTSASRRHDWWPVQARHPNRSPAFSHMLRVVEVCPTCGTWRDRDYARPAATAEERERITWDAIKAGEYALKALPEDVRAQRAAEIAEHKTRLSNPKRYPYE